MAMIAYRKCCMDFDLKDGSGADYINRERFSYAILERVDDIRFEEFGTELYVQYRLYSLDRDAAPSVQDINVGTIGARVKF